MADKAGIDTNSTEFKAAVESAVAEQLKSLKENNAALILEKRTLADKMKAFDGIDADEHKRLKAQIDADESKKLEESKNWEALKKQLIEKHGKELEKTNAQAQKYRSAAEKWLVDAQLSDAIARSGGEPKLLLHLIKNNVKVVENEQGDMEARVVDAKGNPRIGDKDGSPMSFAALVEEMKQDQTYARAFAPSGANGGGAPANSGGNGAANGLRMTAAQVKDNFPAYREARKKGHVEIVNS